MPEIEALGANLVAVSPQLPEKSLATSVENKVTFELLSDVENRTARAFGLVFTLPERLRLIYKKFGIDLPAVDGDESYELPLAATYVINTDGTIALAFIDTDYMKRLEPADAVTAIKRLRSRG